MRDRNLEEAERREGEDLVLASKRVKGSMIFSVVPKTLKWHHAAFPYQQQTNGSCQPCQLHRPITVSKYSNLHFLFLSFRRQIAHFQPSNRRYLRSHHNDGKDLFTNQETFLVAIKYFFSDLSPLRFLGCLGLLFVCK